MVMEIKREFDETKVLADNALLKHTPELFDEWDFEKNSEIDIYKITQGSGKKVWWNCPKCKENYDMEIVKRTSGRNCPYCRGLRVGASNSLQTVRPDIASQWHPTKNDNLLPQDFVCGSHQKVWWLGECGHEWDAKIEDRTKENGTSCAICSNRKLLVGTNDMWSTNPELAKLLANPEDGYKYFQSSAKKVDWVCQECRGIIKNKSINKIVYRGLSCHRCSDGFSFGEKFIYNILREANLDFETEKVFSWGRDKRYDFYLPKFNWIIEVHGIQHYGDGFERIGKTARTLLEEQENDKQKETLAKENKVSKYTVIDARESTTEWLQNSVLKSDLLDSAKNVDFIKVGQMTTNSLVKEASNLWMSGIKSTTGIAQVLKVSRTTILSYLKKGAKLGWCDYCPKESRRKTSAHASKMSRKNIIQLSLSGKVFIKEWSSIAEASMHINNSRTSHISNVCTNKREQTLGFKWMYKEDYDKMIQEGLTHEEYMNKYYPKTK